MGVIKDLTGDRYGRLLVKEMAPRHRGLIHWMCVCDCGNTKSVAAHCLRGGKSTSCGCYGTEQRTKAATKHGMHRASPYYSWRCMNKRCNSPADSNYHLYGGRGITICEKWSTFDGFWEDMAPTWAEGLSLDRIDNDLGYDKSNVKWSTPKEQANNRRSNQLVTMPDGRSLNVTQACDELGFDRNVVYSRINLGWPESRWFEAYTKRIRKPKGEQK